MPTTPLASSQWTFDVGCWLPAFPFECNKWSTYIKPKLSTSPSRVHSFIYLCRLVVENIVCSVHSLVVNVERGLKTLSIDFAHHYVDLKCGQRASSVAGTHWSSNVSLRQVTSSKSCLYVRYGKLASDVYL